MNSSPDGDHEPFSKAWLRNTWQEALARYRELRRAEEGHVEVSLCRATGFDTRENGRSVIKASLRMEGLIKGTSFWLDAAPLLLDQGPRCAAIVWYLY